MTKTPGLVLAAVLWLAAPAFTEEVTRRLGSLTVAVDEAAAYPGGMVTVRLRSTRSLGVVYAILDGRRCPFLLTRRGMRALVPVPVGAPPGPTTLGIEVRGRRGRQRFAFQVHVAERSYPPRAVAIPEVKQAMLSMPGGVRDGRLVQLYLRTVSARQEWHGAFRPPVAAEPEPSFGCAQTYDAEPPVEGKTDAIWGEYHRGLDYPVPAGTEVSSPAAGTILFAGPWLLCRGGWGGVLSRSPAGPGGVGSGPGGGPPPRRPPRGGGARRLPFLCGGGGGPPPPHRPGAGSDRRPRVLAHRIAHVHRHHHAQVVVRGHDAHEHADDGEARVARAHRGAEQVELAHEAAGDRHPGEGDQEHGEGGRDAGPALGEPGQVGERERLAPVAGQAAKAPKPPRFTAA